MKASGSTLDYAIWVVRLFVLIVFGWNILCAIQFIAQPDVYASAYQLEGIPGYAAIRGLGVAFLMWNSTYPFFIINPRKWPILGYVILVQQIIGIIGESFVLASLPVSGFAALSNSIMRFLIFDAAGLLLIVVSLIILRVTTRKILL